MFVGLIFECLLYKDLCIYVIVVSVHSGHNKWSHYLAIIEWVSRTQVTPFLVTQLCKEICDIRRSQKLNTIGNPINRVKKLSKLLSNTPDVDPGKHEVDGLDDVETVRSTLHPSPPNDNPCTQTCRDEDLSPGQIEPSHTGGEGLWKQVGTCQEN